MRAYLVVALWAGLAATARADNPRDAGFMLTLLGGGGSFVDGKVVAPAVGYGAGLGFVFDRAGTVAVKLELDGAASLMAGHRRDRASFSAVLTVWTTDNVSLDLGAGTPVGPNTANELGDGIAGCLRVGYDLVHGRQSALVVRFGVDGENTPGNAGLQIGVSIGFDKFGLGHTIDLSQPR